jgi:Ribonuclease HII
MYSIASASIIAKVTRDRIMTKYHTIYPLYNFIQHKGYPTYEHRQLLFTHGPCAIHRVTFGPVRDSITQRSMTVGNAADKTKKRKISSAPSTITTEGNSSKRKTSAKREEIKPSNIPKKVGPNNRVNKSVDGVRRSSRVSIGRPSKYSR